MSSLNALKEQLAQQIFGRSREACLKAHTCVICGQPAGTFRDAISQKEFAISGMCQKCQDETFCEEEE